MRTALMGKLGFFSLFWFLFWPQEDAISGSTLNNRTDRGPSSNTLSRCSSIFTHSPSRLSHKLVVRPLRSMYLKEEWVQYLPMPHFQIIFEFLRYWGLWFNWNMRNHMFKQKKNTRSLDDSWLSEDATLSSFNWVFAHMENSELIPHFQIIFEFLRYKPTY